MGTTPRKRCSPKRDNAQAACVRLRPAICILVLTGACLSADPALRAQPAKSAACSAPEYHDFDFWLGDWDAFDVDNPAKRIARNRVSRILDGCVLLEDYRPTSGSRGESFTIYDASRKRWHQTWVTSAGKLLIIEGTKTNGAIVLTGVDRAAEGKERQVRGVWKPVSDGVRETATTSTDGGQTWQPWFDIVFRPYKP